MYPIIMKRQPTYHSCPICKSPFRNWVITHSRKTFCSKSCASKARVGPKSSRWKGGIKIHTLGYIMIRIPNHPSAIGGYVFQHRLIMERHLKRFLNPNEHVHHINGLKHDNRLENLQLLTQSGHNRLTNLDRRLKGWNPSKKLMLINQWSRKYPKCRLCHRTSVIHNAHGFCKRCYTKIQRASSTDAGQESSLA